MLGVWGCKSNFIKYFYSLTYKIFINNFNMQIDLESKATK